jgi:hypothetical protein
MLKVLVVYVVQPHAILNMAWKSNSYTLNSPTFCLKQLVYLLFLATGISTWRIFVKSLMWFQTRSSLRYFLTQT